MREYLRRKVDTELLKWLKTKNHAPALVSGIRQCGKSSSILFFARNHFKYINKKIFIFFKKKGVYPLTKLVKCGII